MKEVLARLPRIFSAGFHTFFGPSSCCRFEPSCSQYFSSALRAHGPIRGTLLGLGRILRCRPGKPGGWDPVPKAEGVAHG